MEIRRLNVSLVAFIGIFCIVLISLSPALATGAPDDKGLSPTEDREGSTVTPWSSVEVIGNKIIRRRIVRKKLYNNAHSDSNGHTRYNPNIYEYKTSVGESEKHVNKDGSSTTTTTTTTESTPLSSSTAAGEEDDTVLKDEESPQTLPSPEALIQAQDSKDKLNKLKYSKFIHPKLRLNLLNRTRAFMNKKLTTAAAAEALLNPIPSTTPEPLETPSTSFKLKLSKPKYAIRHRTTPSTTTTEEPIIVEQSTRKPFPIKKFLRRLKSKAKALEKTTTSTTSTTTEEPPTEEENDEDNEDNDNNEETVEEQQQDEEADDTNTEATEEEQTIEETRAPVHSEPSPKVVPKRKWTTTTTTTTEPTTTTTTTTTTTQAPEPQRPQANNNSTMIIIPVPPSQRKPYHPVIMQVTKTPPTADSLPETRVVTYKLNKMFVPIGIYGKVLPRNATAKDYQESSTAKNSIVSTPLPFILPGQSTPAPPTVVIPQATAASSIHERIMAKHHPGVHLKTPSPNIKVKGHRSQEVTEAPKPTQSTTVAHDEPITSGDNSQEYAAAVAYAASQKAKHEQLQKQWEHEMDKLKKKSQRGIADTISLTYDYKPNPDKISFTTERVNIDKISLTTEEPMMGAYPPTGPSGWSGYNAFTNIAPPRPFKPSATAKPSKTIFETITSAASSIPGLIHEGLSTLSGFNQAFEDELAFPKQRPSAPAPSPNQPGTVLPVNDAETLEFFRKRPHLLKNRGKKSQKFGSDSYTETLSGFKPVTAPPHFAKEYYASTPTTPKPLSPFSKYTNTAPTAFDNPSITTNREPLFKDSNGWDTLSSSGYSATTQRSPKNLITYEDMLAFRQSQRGRSNPFDDYMSTTTTTESPYLQESFTDQWNQISSKYSKNEIDDAKDRIFSLFSKDSSPTWEDMMYMKPPTKSGNAFDDLLKMFKMGFSFGAGHSSSKSPAFSMNMGMHKDEYSTTSNTDDGWVPLTKSGGNKIISLNAGITFGGKPTPTSSQFGFGGGSHYSGSNKPFVPPTKYDQEQDFSHGGGSNDATNNHYSTISNAALANYKHGSSSSGSHHYNGNSGNNHYSGGSGSHPFEGSSSGKNHYKGGSSGGHFDGSSVKNHYNSGSGSHPFEGINHYGNNANSDSHYNKGSSSSSFASSFRNNNKNKGGSHFSKGVSSGFSNYSPPQTTEPTLLPPAKPSPTSEYLTNIYYNNPKGSSREKYQQQKEREQSNESKGQIASGFDMAREIYELRQKYLQQQRETQNQNHEKYLQQKEAARGQSHESSSKGQSIGGFDINPAISTHFAEQDAEKPFANLYSDNIRSEVGNPSQSQSHSQAKPYSSDPSIEIVSSSQYFKQKGKMNDIAAVIKPPEISDALVKAALPPQISSVPQLSYPTQQLIQHPTNFRSLSQLQQYFATAQTNPTHSYPTSPQTPPTVHPTQQLQHQFLLQQIQQQQQQQTLEKLRHQGLQQINSPQLHHPHAPLFQAPQSHQVNHHQFQQQQQQAHYQMQQQEQARQQFQQQEQAHQQLQQQEQARQQLQQQEQAHQQMQQQLLFQQAQQQQQQFQSQPSQQQQQFQSQPSQQQGAPGPLAQHPSQYATTGDSGVGFTDFDLPAGLDPDIAALLKTELDKDDIPDEFRKDFLEAQENEKAKQKQQQQGTAASRVSFNLAKPPQRKDTNRRADSKPEIKFHKPIPISPTMLTPSRGKPIRASPVPKYVVELARKLKKDKDVQGIVRVSAKREKGPPIEYLYPVRG